MSELSSYPNHIPVLNWVILALQFLGCCRKKPNLISIFTSVSLIFMVLLLLWDISINFEGIASLKRIRFMPACFMAMVKGILMILQSKDYLKVVEEVKDFWKPLEFDLETRNYFNRIFKIVTILCPFYISFCLSFCVILAGISWIDLDKREFVLGNYSFCDEFASFSCWFSMWLWQSFLLLGQAVPVSCLFDCFFIICVAYVYNGCELLKAAFKRLDSDSLRKRYDALREVVEQHHVIMTFIINVNNLYTGFMLVQFWCSLWSLILYLYMIVIDGIPPKAADAVLFGTLYCIFSFQLLIYALGGTVIEEQLRSLSTAMFEINWDGKGRTELRKDLSFMIFRAQNATILSVGKMSHLNLVLFLNVIKNSLSVLTLILQLDK